MRLTGFSPHHSCRCPWAKMLCRIARPLLKLWSLQPKAFSSNSRHSRVLIARSGRAATPSTRSIRRTKCRKSRSVVALRPARASTLSLAACSKDTVCSSARTAATPARITRRSRCSMSSLVSPCALSPSSSVASSVNLAMSFIFSGKPLMISFAVFMSIFGRWVCIVNADASKI